MDRDLPDKRVHAAKVRHSGDWIVSHPRDYTCFNKAQARGEAACLPTVRILRTV